MQGFACNFQAVFVNIFVSLAGLDTAGNAQFNRTPCFLQNKASLSGKLGSGLTKCPKYRQLWKRK
ncbi:hypothetical protein C7N43_34090 [Sphingobacteriales bacterium UPWRP_1]|nr:hypothetical protein C7N43_34090 [Sphingobacteriales bacterium UPWRP_1]